MKVFRSESDIAFCTVIYQVCLQKTGYNLPKEIRMKCLSYSPNHRFMRPLKLEFDWDMDMEYNIKGARKYNKKAKKFNGIKKIMANYKLKKAFKFR